MLRGWRRVWKVDPWPGGRDASWSPPSSPNSSRRIDGGGKLLALALHARPAGNLTFAGGILHGVANLDVTLSLVMADDQAIWRDAGTTQLERMRCRAIGEELLAA